MCLKRREDADDIDHMVRDLNIQKICKIKPYGRTSLVVQWIRICHGMQGTLVRSLVGEDSTCRTATKLAFTSELLRPQATATEACAATEALEAS